MGDKKRKYKWFSIDSAGNGLKRWHIGAFFCKDYEQIYFMIAIGKWDICIGKLINWDYEW